MLASASDSPSSHQVVVKVHGAEECSINVAPEDEGKAGGENTDANASIFSKVKKSLNPLSKCRMYALIQC